MSGKWSTAKRCNCKDPETGREIGRNCPKLKSRRHGGYGYATRIPTSKGVTELRRFGFKTAGDADKAARHVWDLLSLAGADASTQKRIGDLVAEKTRRGGELPSVEDVRRRLGLRRDPGDEGETFADAWDAYLKGKRKSKRDSTVRGLEQIGEHWLLPVLKDVPVERITGQHCQMVFDRIDQFNAHIAAAEAKGLKGRKAAPEGDNRRQVRYTKPNRQHRIFEALRAFLNVQWKVKHIIPFNPVYAVELPPIEPYEAQRWTREQTRRFLEASASDPLGLLMRIVVLCGARRAEACGFRWAYSDLDAGYVAVRKPLVQLGKKIVESGPKTDRSGRKIWLDHTTLALLREWRKQWLMMRLRAGGRWQDNDLVFCQPDGSPWKPQWVSRRWRQIAKAAGLPVIRFHDGRHTATSNADDAGVDVETRRDILGHTTTVMTEHYTHRERARLQGAANQAAAFVEGAGETGTAGERHT